MINIFIPHRWNNEDYPTISALFDRSKYVVRDYSVPIGSQFDSIDGRYNVDPQIRKQISYATVVVCSNRPAIGFGMASDEIRFAKSIGKLIVAIAVTPSNSSLIGELDIPVIPNRRDSLETWIRLNV